MADGAQDKRLVWYGQWVRCKYCLGTGKTGAGDCPRCFGDAGYLSARLCREDEVPQNVAIEVARSLVVYTGGSAQAIINEAVSHLKAWPTIRSVTATVRREREVVAIVGGSADIVVSDVPVEFRSEEFKKEYLGG